MRKRLTELMAVMDETRGALMATVAGAGGAFASVRPREDAWSVAEILAHLALVEAGVARLVGGSVSWARKTGVPPETSDESILACLDQYQLTSRNRKMKAPAMVDVGAGGNMADAVKSLERSRADLRKALVEGDGLDLESVTRPHARLGEINLYQWVLFVAQHEERHRQQIEETLRDVTGRAAECAPIV